MKNKKIITIFCIFIITILLIIVFVNSNKSSKKNLNTKESLSCAKEGETIGSYGMPISCCSGLKKIGGWPGGYNGNCNLIPPPTGLNICSNCGNKKCDIGNGENKCNCQEDCK